MFIFTIYICYQTCCRCHSRDSISSIISRMYEVVVVVVVVITVLSVIVAASIVLVVEYTCSSNRYLYR